MALSRDGDVLAIERDGRVRWRAARAVEEVHTYSGIAGSARHGVAVSFGRAAAIWDLATGRLRAAIPSPAHVSALAFDPASARFAIGDIAGAITVWDAVTAAPVATCAAHGDTIRALVFAPDGSAVVSGGSDGEVRVCDASTGAVVHRLLGHGHAVLTVDVSPDGQTIVSGGRDGKPRLWAARTGLLVATLEGHRGAVWIARFSPDGERVLTLGSDDGAARLWNREGMALGSLQGHGRRLSAGFWDRDGRHVVTAGTDGALRRWDADLAIRARPRQVHTAAVVGIALSSDDRWALTAGEDGAAVLWDLRAQSIKRGRAPSPPAEPVGPLPPDSLRSSMRARLGHGSAVQSVAFAPRDGATALTTDRAGAARLWSVPDGALRATLGATGVTAAAYAGDAGPLVTAEGHAIRFWTASGAVLGAVSIGYAADRLIVTPGGRWLIARGATSAIAVIDIAARTAVAQLAIADKHALAIAADGSRVAITDRTEIRLWELGTWRPAGVLIGHRSAVSELTFLGDGRLVSFAEDAALIWGRDHQIRGRIADGEYVFSLAESADGAIIATAANDGAVRIWDAATYRRLLVLPSHRLAGYAVAVTRDGTSVLSAGLDGRLVAWDLDRRPWTPAALAELVRCRVPYRLDGDVVLPRDLDFADPTCAALR
jgi:WD40 repeat protein